MRRRDFAAIATGAAVEVTGALGQSRPATAARSPRRTQPGDREVLYFGSWTEARDQGGEACRRSHSPYHACEFTFTGPAVRWLGSKGPDHGLADLYVDGVRERTIDAYAPAPLAAQVLFEKTRLGPAGRIHTLRIVVRRERNPASTDCYQGIHGFESTGPVDYPKHLRAAATAELQAITSGTKPYLAPGAWKPVAYAAVAPAKGVVLQPGPLRDCFEKNIAYLNRCFLNPYLSAAGNNNWFQQLPASAEGRMLAGAGHSLRWGERADLRRIVDTIVGTVKTRQRADGYCLPYDESFMKPMKDAWKDERRNYDRVGLTRGMVAAGMSGNPDAYRVMRRFYDWFYRSPYYAGLLAGAHSGSSHNCNNGHAGSLLMYFSPVGRPEDLVAVERYFVQDFFIEQARNAEPLSLGYYPLHTPHSYVLLAFESWLDHYRATGAAKYLDAARGAWRIVRENYEHIGGSIAICEMDAGAYPPGSYYLGKHTGETCGSVFWADFNHRLLQLYPGEERYAAEIETVVYNVILAVQDGAGSIRYHSNLDGAKEASQCANTCCEVMGVPFIARLPQYVYSLAADGVYVNLFAASTIVWPHAGQNVTLTTATEFPNDGKVKLAIGTSAPVRMKLRIRVPSWAGGKLAIRVNGAPAAEGAPGSYVSLDRTWSNNDSIAFELPMRFRPRKYTGFDQDKTRDRYALQYGPLLMALAGGAGLDIAPDALANRLSPVSGSPLHFQIAGHPGCKYMPYWQVRTEKFTCFPALG